MKPNSDYLETHFEMTSCIVLLIERGHDALCLFEGVKGLGGLWRLAEEWTDEFIEKYKGNYWNEDNWIEEVEVFQDEKIKELNHAIKNWAV